MSQANSPSKGTPRRVLGEITTKALNTPSKRVDPSEGTRAQSPLKQMQTLSPQLFGGKENASLSLSKGKKRSIHEVDDPERVENPKARVGGSTAGKTGLSKAAVILHTDNHHIIDLPVPGSPTERNTPTPEPEAHEVHEVVNSQGTQGSNNSFSALINYDLCASQNSVQAPPSRAPTPPTPEEERKRKAELLRTRLGFSIYKVKTNQIAKSGKDIITTWESSVSEARDAYYSAPITTSRELKEEHQVPDISAPPVCRPEFLTANLDPFRPIGRLDFANKPNFEIPKPDEQDVPSSPPQQAVSPEHFKLPVKPQLDYATPVNQSPGSERVDTDPKAGRAQSGIRKLQRLHDGNAAEGLMQLVAGKR